MINTVSLIITYILLIITCSYMIFIVDMLRVVMDILYAHCRNCTLHTTSVNQYINNNHLVKIPYYFKPGYDELHHVNNKDTINTPIWKFNLNNINPITTNYFFSNYQFPMIRLMFHHSCITIILTFLLIMLKILSLTQ